MITNTGSTTSITWSRLKCFFHICPEFYHLVLGVVERGVGHPSKKEIMHEVSKLFFYDCVFLAMSSISYIQFQNHVTTFDYIILMFQAYILQLVAINVHNCD